MATRDWIILISGSQNFKILSAIILKFNIRYHFSKISHPADIAKSGSTQIFDPSKKQNWTKKKLNKKEGRKYPESSVTKMQLLFSRGTKSVLYGKKYQWLPKSQKFSIWRKKKYGIKNVVGNQSCGFREEKKPHLTHT